MKNVYKLQDELYIISPSEKIKENTITSKEGFNGDWFYNTIYNFIARTGYITPYDFKIILTTDPDLIADGIQAIDDEFLQWFVDKANDSGKPIDIVEIKKQYITPLGDIVDTCYDNERLNYKIIIPKDEPKQEYCNNCNNDICCCIIRKQETLEEAKNNAWYNYEHVEGNLYSTSFKNGFELGAKWQARRMYTEAELYELTLKALDLGMKIRQDQLNGSCDKSGKELHKEWFEQHKKQTL